MSTNDLEWLSTLILCPSPTNVMVSYILVFSFVTFDLSCAKLEIFPQSTTPTQFWACCPSSRALKNSGVLQDTIWVTLVKKSASCIDFPIQVTFAPNFNQTFWKRFTAMLMTKWHNFELNFW